MAYFFQVAGVTNLTVHVVHIVHRGVQLRTLCKNDKNVHSSRNLSCSTIFINKSQPGSISVQSNNTKTITDVALIKKICISPVVSQSMHIFKILILKHRP